MHQYRLVCRLYYLGLGRDLSTNLTIIAISLFYNLPSEECWFKTGYWDHERYVAIHEIARNLGPDLCNALPIVHDLTGCDSTSSFAGHGKVDPWRKVVSNIAKWPGLLEAGTCTVPSQEVLDKLATENKINDLRYRLFCTSQRMVSNLPPTEDVLYQHALRACYQTYIWRRSVVAQPFIPPPTEHGWAVSEDSIYIKLVFFN